MINPPLPVLVVSLMLLCDTYFLGPSKKVRTPTGLHLRTVSCVTFKKEYDVLMRRCDEFMDLKWEVEQ